MAEEWNDNFKDGTAWGNCQSCVSKYLKLSSVYTGKLIMFSVWSLTTNTFIPGSMHDPFDLDHTGHSNVDIQIQGNKK